MAIVMTEQSAQNMEYVRRLLKQRQPEFAAALELAAADCLCGGFIRGFATADRERVVVAAHTQRQFADLARATRRARTFAFLERLLDADFSACADLYTHRAAIAVLLTADDARATEIALSYDAPPVFQPAATFRGYVGYDANGLPVVVQGKELERGA